MPLHQSRQRRLGPFGRPPGIGRRRELDRVDARQSDGGGSLDGVIQDQFAGTARADDRRRLCARGRAPARSTGEQAQKYGPGAICGIGDRPNRSDRLPLSSTIPSREPSGMVALRASCEPGSRIRSQAHIGAHIVKRTSPETPARNGCPTLSNRPVSRDRALCLRKITARRAARHVLGAGRQPARHAGAVPARRPGCGSGRRASPVLRPALLPHHHLRSARLRTLAAARHDHRQHHSAAGRRHRGAASSPYRAAVDTVRRLVGIDARARLWHALAAALRGLRASRHFPRHPPRSLLVSLRHGDLLSRRLGGVSPDCCRNPSVRTCSRTTTAA